LAAAFVRRAGPLTIRRSRYATSRGFAAASQKPHLSSQELISERDSDVVNSAWVRKRWRILDPELQVVLASIEERYSSSEQEPEAAAILVGISAPEPDSSSRFDVESVRQPPLHRWSRNSGDLAVITEAREIVANVRPRKTKHQRKVSRQETADAKIQASQTNFGLFDTCIVLHANPNVYKSRKPSTVLREPTTAGEGEGDSGENSNS
jgi:hypothetical protein